MRDVAHQPPAYKISVTQLQCAACGAETHAACSCGAWYKPKGQRAAEAVAANPEKSNRVIAAETGVSEGTVRTARVELGSDYAVYEPRTGKDGKTRRLPEPKAAHVQASPPRINWDQIKSAMAIIRAMDLHTRNKFDDSYKKLPIGF
jgi:hypothetical protein